MTLSVCLPKTVSAPVERTYQVNQVFGRRNRERCGPRWMTTRIWRLMASNIDPWREIDEPSSDDLEILRRVGPEHELDFYRGRLFGGGYFLRLVVDSEPPSELVLPTLSNITITCVRA